MTVVGKCQVMSGNTQHSIQMHATTVGLVHSQASRIPPYRDTPDSETPDLHGLPTLAVVSRGTHYGYPILELRLVDPRGQLHHAADGHAYSLGGELLIPHRVVVHPDSSATEPLEPGLGQGGGCERERQRPLIH